MDLNKNYIKKTLFLKRKKISSALTAFNYEGQGITSTNQSNSRTLLTEDSYINVLLTKTCEIYEYVDVKRDEKIYTVDRQLINPYYINFDFFNTVKRIKVNTSNDLTQDMINYLDATYWGSISQYSSSPAPILTWFDEIGYNILVNDIIVTVDPVTGLRKEENGIERLEKLSKNSDSIISKAFYFPIDINK